MSAICPFMSSANSQVNCTTKCALCWDGECSINRNKVNTQEISKKLDTLNQLINHLNQRR